MIADEPVDEARFTPVMLLSYIYRHATEANMESSKQYAIYSLNINKAIVSLYIRKKDDLLEKVTAKSNDDLYGDVTTAISYSGYTAMDHICYPSVIYIDKINGKVKDTIAITSATFTKEMKPVLEKPAGYKLAEEKITKPEISVEKYNDHIHFITLKHTNGRAMVVEYNDYLLVAEAPLNSGNGELIIAEARKIAPGKPIKYFVFCHYHPDYIGGIRAFIHKGATVLCTKGDMQYVEYLANASHTMNPDSLELQPQQLQTEDIGGHKTISDGKYQMEIYFIGSKSEHTKDYLVYYFPQEKMLFEGDLAWIPEKGPAKKAGKRQAGLYHAIKDLNLDVAMIEQSWPASGYGIKTEIPFTEMEEAMNMR
jgi:glyoxylase-like metal-dependent hydrolase (beta-lactamase superfamily II)